MTNSLPTLLFDLADAGAVLVAHGDRLRFRPADLPAPLVARIREQKAALLGLLNADPAARDPGTPAWCSQVAQSLQRATVADQRNGQQCRWCRRRRWWRTAEPHPAAPWICATCHPPSEALALEWRDG